MKFKVNSIASMFTWPHINLGTLMTQASAPMNLLFVQALICGHVKGDKIGWCLLWWWLKTLIHFLMHWKSTHWLPLQPLKTLPSTPCLLHPSLTSSTVSTSAMTANPTSRKGKVTADVLAKRWNIGLETARKTLQSTTQLAVRDFTHTTGGRRLKPYSYQLRYPRLNVEMYTDTLIGRCTSLSGNKYAQVYATPFHWVCVDPIPLKSDAHLTLETLFRRVGVPRVIIPDNAKELTEGLFKKKALRAGAAILPI